jgi:hypothetical protein
MKTSMAGPLGGAITGFGNGHHLVDEDVDGRPLRVLPVGPAAATTKVVDVIKASCIDDGRPGKWC